MFLHHHICCPIFAYKLKMSPCICIGGWHLSREKRHTLYNIPFIVTHKRVFCFTVTLENSFSTACWSDEQQSSEDIYVDSAVRLVAPKSPGIHFSSDLDGCLSRSVWFISFSLLSKYWNDHQSHPRALWNIRLPSESKCEVGESVRVRVRGCC